MLRINLSLHDVEKAITAKISNRIFSSSKRGTNKTKRRTSLFNRDESGSFEGKIPAVDADGSRGSARYCKKGQGQAGERAGERASERDRKRRGIKARETGQTSCYILEEHSNSDMKREAHSVNEDPRGNASGTRRRERRGTVYTHAPATRAKGRKKGVSGMEKGPSRERRGGNRGARVVPREHSRPSDSVRSPRSPSFICLALSAREADPN